MDGMLSQDEINALLSGMDIGSIGSASDTPAESAPATSAPDTSAGSAGTAVIDESLLTPIERDAIGEVANISMGSSATTLYSLVYWSLH